MATTVSPKNLAEIKKVFEKTDILDNLAAGTLTSIAAAQKSLFPWYTTTVRDALTGVPEGLIIYNSTTKKLNFYNGSAWAAITSV